MALNYKAGIYIHSIFRFHLVLLMKHTGFARWFENEKVETCF